MPELREVNRKDIDPRIARHLGSGEVVLWQGTPRATTFLSPIALVAGILIVGFAILSPFGVFDRLVYLPGSPFSLNRILPSLFGLAVGGFLLLSMWTGRGGNWAYAITDRRLMSVRGKTLARSVAPGDVRSFERKGDIAYWRYLNDRILGENESRDVEKRYPGFHGLDDAADMVATLTAWREEFTTRAGEDAAAFLEQRASTVETPDDVPEGARRIRHDATGLTLEVPEGWRANVSLDRIGPLRLFGVTLLERFIRPGKEQPYAEGLQWNTLTVRGAPDAGLNVTILDEPLTKTFEEVRDEPWAQRLDLKLIKSTPEIEQGELRGFSLVRQMPTGANLASFGPVAAPVATRQVWLGRGSMHIEVVGMARLDQPAIQDAIDAMIDSIRLGG